MRPRPLPVLFTPRLCLRPFSLSDRVAFAALNADPRVMACFVSTLSIVESDALIEHIQQHFTDHGFGAWAVEDRTRGTFLGFTGLARVPAELPCAPAVELAYRFAFDAWGVGLAQEAAREAVRFGFEELELPQIVSFTAQVNGRSRRVMEALAMERLADFVHPRVPEGHRLQQHVLHRLTRTSWRQPRDGRYHVRAAQPRDFAAMHEVERRAAQRFRELAISDAVSAPGHRGDWLARHAEHEAVQVLEHEDEVVGFAIGCTLDGVPHLAELAVLPEHAGLRLGARLIEAVVARARAQGHTQLTLTTFRDVPWNGPYCRTLGFTEAPLSAFGPDHQRAWEAERTMGYDMARRTIMTRTLAHLG